MAAPDGHWPLSSESHVAGPRIDSCVLGQRPPELALSGATSRRDPLILLIGVELLVDLVVVIVIVIGRKRLGVDLKAFQ
jgi:hypothetical protein